ncbi:30S ribosomal protein S17 [Patescibacteria group bacterium]
MKQKTTEIDKKNAKKEIIGQVVSIKMQKTIVISVKRSFRHSLYKKIVRRDNRYFAHCERDDIAVGDTVKISETKPMSKKKHFIVVDKVTK